MNMEKLKSILSKNSKVTGDLLKSKDISEVLNSWFVNGALEIKNFSIIKEDKDKQIIEVKGKIDFLSINNLPSLISFFIVDGTTQMIISMDFPKGWKFSDSFPSLKDNYFDIFKLNSVQFILTSYSKDNYSKGCNFKSEFVFPEIWRMLNWFLKFNEKLILSGVITLEHKLPVMNLSVKPLFNYKFNDSLNFNMQLENIAQTYLAKKPNSTPTTNTYSLLTTTLSYNNNGKRVNVPLEVLFSEHLSVFNFRLYTKEIFNLALQEISHWIGGVNLTKEALPSSYNPLGVTLSHLDFAIGLYTQSLEYVIINISTTSNWEIIESVISIEKVTIDFMVVNPLNKNKREINTSINGIVNFNLGNKQQLVLDIYASFPEFVVIGGLAEEEAKPNLGVLFASEHLLKTNAEVPNTLIIESIDFYAYYKIKQFEFKLDVIGSWEILPSIAIKEIFSSITYNNGSVTAIIKGVFNISQIEFFISSMYESELKGWTFSGGTPKDYHIPAGKFAEELIKIFGFSDNEVNNFLPEPIRGMTINEIEVEFNTATKKFTFICVIDFPLDKNNTLTMNFVINIEKNQSGKYTKTFGGQIDINGYKFTLIFDKDPTKNSLIATYSHDPSTGIINLPTILDGIINKDYVPNIDIDLQSAFIAFLNSKGENPQKNRVFGVNMSATINLSDLPLIGAILPENSSAGFKSLKLVVASNEVDKEKSKEFNQILQNGGVEFLPPKFQDGVNLKKGTNFYSELMVTGIPLEVNLPLRLPTMKDFKPTKISSSSNKDNKNNNSIQEPDGTLWYPIQKNIGPIHFERIGVKYADFSIHFPLDVGLNISIIEIYLHSVSIGFSLLSLANMKDFSPKFNLKGIGFKLEKYPLKIGLDLLYSTIEGEDGKLYDEYSGMGVVGFASFSLSIMGIYSNVNQDTSLFMYGRAGFVPIGPPFFMVSGFSIGAGYNRKLIAPPLKEISTFPLVQDAMQTSPKSEMGSMLTSLKKHITLSKEENFFAVGISFNVCKLVDGFAMLIFNIGEHFSINILGYAYLSLPPKDVLGDLAGPLVFIELTLKASFEPAKGVLSIRGALTDKCYLFTAECRLYGGFAFVMWFDDEHFGDFVLTFGGYHPLFKIPSHYPKDVPRIGSHIDLGIVSIKSELYFALTARAIMAGGVVEGKFSFIGLEAWFNFSPNFIISWEPLFFDAEVFAKVGGKLGILSAEIATDIHIWGPDLGGRVSFELLFISIDVEFGVKHPGSKLKPISWEKFSNTFLPPKDKVCNIAVKEGLLRTLNEESIERWIISPSELVITVRSFIPIKELLNYEIAGEVNKNFNIAPMGGNIEFDSKFSIFITKDGFEKDLINDFIVKPILQNFPAALWGDKMLPSIDEDSDKQLIKSLVAGYTIETKKEEKSNKIDKKRKELNYETTFNKKKYSWQNLTNYVVEAKNQKEKLKTIKDTLNYRKELLKELQTELILEKLELEEGISNLNELEAKGFKLEEFIKEFEFEIDKVPFEIDNYITLPLIRKEV